MSKDTTAKPLPTFLPAHLLRLLAVKACVDPRTAAKVLAGGKTASTTAFCVRRAYEALRGRGELP